ncbi:MAG: V-type ATP synthase subunit A [Thermoplasmata archaeon]|nr:V-type ATP synthase subunit A [Thermoplasmata archaeon]
MSENDKQGEIFRVAGPVVTATGINPRMYDVVFIGEEKLMGEVIQIVGEKSIIQVYEDTSGIRPGEPVIDTGKPLTAELGPGLLSSIYDGIQRPLQVLQEKMGDIIERGVNVPGLDHEKKWDFNPTAQAGDKVTPNSILGWVQESQNIKHHIMVPPGKSGTITDIKTGSFTIDETIATLDDGTQLMMHHKWPVRNPRPIRQKLAPDIPLITGQRVLDTFFPIAKGGTAAIPGGFGTGKTVTEHQLAKWSDADIVVYVGCGERGNEMADVLKEFPELEDPKSGAPLMDRTILIANTSNMPVAAREASVYTGITMAEYYRDMGYDIALMADSTSRWAEAMREISSRLEEMPGEEGYPAYLSSKLSEFYERAGRVTGLNEIEGSVSVIGAVSPQGGDFSEPVTQATLRIVKVFWALDTKLRERRHFPAVNWLNSYSLYTRTLDPWFSENVDKDWTQMVKWAMAVLQKEAELQEIVQLVGADALPDDQRVLLEVARMLREYFLQQNAFHDVDTFCSPARQENLLSCIKKFNDESMNLVSSGIPITDIMKMKSKDDMAKVKYEQEFEKELEKVMECMMGECELMRGKVEGAVESKPTVDKAKPKPAAAKPVAKEGDE